MERSKATSRNGHDVVQIPLLWLAGNFAAGALLVYLGRGFPWDVSDDPPLQPISDVLITALLGMPVGFVLTAVVSCLRACYFQACRPGIASS